MRKPTLLLIPALLGLAASGYASDTISPENMSLGDAVRLALEHNESIQSAAAGQEVARARITEARSGWYPSVNYAESWTGSNNPAFVFASRLSQGQVTAADFAIPNLNDPGFYNNFQSLISADQVIYDAGKVKKAVQTAELAKQSADETLRRNKMEVIALVVRLYSDVQLAGERLNATARALESAQADLERAEARRASGMATDADVLSIRVHVAAVREEQIQRQADLANARAAVNNALGLPLDTDHRFTTELMPLPSLPKDLAALENGSVEERAEARQLRLAKETANVQLSAAKANLLPQISIRGAFEADRREFFNDGRGNWLVATTLRWNLFNGFGDKARIEASKAALRQAASEQARAESGIRLQVRRAWEDLKAAQERIQTAQASVAEAEESLRILQNRYAAGLATVTDLLRTETALLETRTRYLAAVRDERIAGAMLEWAAGTLSPQSEVLR